MATNKFKKIHCELGDHDYDWEVKRGRKPKNCAAHKAEQTYEPKEKAPPSIRAAIIRVQGWRSQENCNCGITPDTTAEQIRALGKGCTDLWVCPFLDAVRRAIT